MAKTYLATALAQNVAPGVTTPDNLKTANQAIDIFKEVLAQNPNDVNSMKQIAGIYFSIKDMDDAEAWQKKVLDVDPNDPEAAYTIGVIDWKKAHQNKLNALQAAGLNDDGKGNVKAPKKVMEPLAQENAPLVDEGLKYLTMAVNDRPNYDDAMQYLNLIYRNKADVDYGNAAAVTEDLAMAEDWTATRPWTRARPTSKRRIRAPAASPWITAARCTSRCDFLWHRHQTASALGGGRFSLVRISTVPRCSFDPSFPHHANHCAPVCLFRVFRCLLNCSASSRRNASSFRDARRPVIRRLRRHRRS